MQAGPVFIETAPSPEKIHLPYTTCFCLCGDKVLLLFRRNEPHALKWNGLGGKRAEGEARLQTARRETREETEGLLDIRNARCWYAGMVSWAGFNGAPQDEIAGMHVYFAEFEPSELTALLHCRETREGLLDWVELEEAFHDPYTVETIHLYLPKMLASTDPLHCHFNYSGQHVTSWNWKIMEPADFQF